MYNSSCLILYPFPTPHLNLSWWSYLCILRLIFNIAWSFKSFVGRKENHFNLFYHVFCQGDFMRHEWYAKKKLLACQILRRKCNGMTFSSTRMLLFCQRHKDNPQRVFRQERSWVKNLSVRYILSYCFIDNNALISLYIVFNS